MQPPALTDKKLEALVGFTVDRAKKGDPTALKNVSGLAGTERFWTQLGYRVNSCIGGFFPRAVLLLWLLKVLLRYSASAPGLISRARANPQAQVVPSGIEFSNLQQKSLLVGDDASKLQVYFGALGQNDERFSGLSKGTKNWTSNWQSC